MAQWPTQLPGFLRDGYTIEPQPQIARTDMDAGPARQRRRYTCAPTVYSMQWLFTQQEMAIFEAWYEHEIAAGTEWFHASIWNGTGYSQVEARFVEPWRASLPGPTHFGVDARLEVRNPRILSQSEYLEALALPLIEYDFTATGSLAQVIRNSAQPRAPIEFSRDSIATYFDAEGVMRIAEAHAPRFDHDPATHEPLGLLIEAERENFINYSAQLDEPVWLRNGCTVAAGDSYAPDGEPAQKIASEMASGNSRLYQEVPVAAAKPYTFSCFFHAGESTQVSLGSYLDTLGVASVDVNLADLNVLATDGSLDDYGVQNIGNGWCRIWLTLTSATDGVAHVGFQFSGVTDTGLYAWGAQFEQYPFPTSYFPTTVAATRAAEFVRANIAKCIAPAGTFTASTSIPYHRYAYMGAVVFAANDGSQDNQFDCHFYSAGLSTRIRKDGVDLSSIVFPDLLPKANCAIAYTLNEHAMALNGVLKTASPHDGLPDGIVQLEIGARARNAFINGHIQRLAYYPTRWSDEKLTEATNA